MKPNKSERLIGGRLQSIDALRGAAALGVVFYHALTCSRGRGLTLVYLGAGSSCCRGSSRPDSIAKMVSKLVDWRLGYCVGSTISVLLPVWPKDTPLHNIAWILMHPIWGVGFFILVNYAVQAESSWLSRLPKPGVIANRVTRIFPRLVAVTASIGVFSYSLYLTHELVFMQWWRFVTTRLPPMLNTLLIVAPATIIFAGLFFTFCEKPYMRKLSERWIHWKNVDRKKPLHFSRKTSGPSLTKREEQWLFRKGTCAPGAKRADKSAL